VQIARQNTTGFAGGSSSFVVGSKFLLRLAANQRVLIGPLTGVSARAYSTRSSGHHDVYLVVLVPGSRKGICSRLIRRSGAVKTSLFRETKSPVREELHTDSRRAPRYRLGARASFTWKENGGPTMRGEGVTRDVGLFGAYVFSKTCPPVHSMLRLRVYLPTFPTTVRALQVQSIVRVVRQELDTETGISGFAAVCPGSAKCLRGNDFAELDTGSRTSGNERVDK